MIVLDILVAPFHHYILVDPEPSVDEFMLIEDVFGNEESLLVIAHVDD